MIKIDHTRYIVIRVPGEIKGRLKDASRSIEIDKTRLLFVPLDRVKDVLENFEGNYRIITVSWSIMYPVLNKLSDEDWDFKFENDKDWVDLESINEKGNSQKERLEKVREYFESKYDWPDGIPDPVLHTRLIIEPRDSNTSFVFYYGETVELQNNNEEDIKHLFGLIMKEYERTEYSSLLSEMEMKKETRCRI